MINTVHLQYLNIIILSLILVQLFYPVYAFIKRQTKSNGLATTLSIILVIVLIVVPIALIVSLTINEIQNVIRTTHILDNLEGLQAFRTGIDQAVAACQRSNAAHMPEVRRRSNVVGSNLRPRSAARRQDALSSACVGRRAISAYLSRYLALPGSQKLSGWNCAITFTGA